ncbi:MAG: sugar phosphate isomerase/epimerase [Clostridiales bacterium]|nr:sugar phosphate isomerase/epimerase [Clostridiales bacterium]MDY3745669.1 sugar phosphate isomerase/epimerase family protein [Lachnospiraceae bacterium]
MASIKREQLVAMNQHYRRFSLDYFLDCQERVGFKNIELWCGAAHFYIDSKGHESCEPLKKKLRARGLKVVSVTTPSCAYQYQYASQEEKSLEESFKYFANGIEVAAELGADRVVVNSGWGYIHENEKDMWKRSAENLYRLAEIAKRYDIVCMMESMRDDETNIVNSLETAKKMFDQVNHPNLKMMVDSIATGAAGESLDAWFDTFGKNLIHMHFLDGDPYLHNVWGDGNTSLEQQLQTLNKYSFTGYLVQEVADEKYFSNPYLADIKNMRVLERFIEE